MNDTQATIKEQQKQEKVYKDFDVYLLKMCMVKIGGVKIENDKNGELAEACTELFMDGVRDISTLEEREELDFWIKSIERKTGRAVIIEKKDGKFTILLTNIYLVKIKTLFTSDDDYNKAAKMVEMFTDKISDISTPKQRKAWGFEIESVEQTRNEVFLIR